ncbi:hypothetical protein GCM10010317_037490 [Streptomyces mirabilis]|nr:hypothetical protein GCM10010317_037490 [Streptomyces mirabilis]
MAAFEALVPTRPLMGHHGGDGSRRQIAGGVMRLGKALATGVAEERTRADEDNLQLPEEIEELEASVPEEVPVAR